MIISAKEACRKTKNIQEVQSMAFKESAVAECEMAIENSIKQGKYSVCVSILNNKYCDSEHTIRAILTELKSLGYATSYNNKNDDYYVIKISWA